MLLLSLLVFCFACSNCQHENPIVSMKDKPMKNHDYTLFANYLTDTFSFKNLNALVDSILEDKNKNPLLCYDKRFDTDFRTVINIRDEFGLNHELVLSSKNKTEITFMHNQYTKIILNKKTKKMYCVTKSSYQKDGNWNAIFLLDNMFLPIYAIKKGNKSTNIYIEKYIYDELQIEVFSHKAELSDLLIQNNFKDLNYNSIDTQFNAILNRKEVFTNNSLPIDSHFLHTPLWVDPLHHYPEHY